MLMMLRPRGEPAEEHVDAHVRVLAQRVGRAQQEHDAEEVPLQLEIRVRAEVHADIAAEVARDRVERADQDHQQHQPGYGAADHAGHPVNAARDAEHARVGDHGATM
jgi:hypothetical protein